MITFLITSRLQVGTSYPYKRKDGPKDPRPSLSLLFPLHFDKTFDFFQTFSTSSYFTGYQTLSEHLKE